MAADPSHAIAPYLQRMPQPALIVAVGKAAVPIAEQAFPCVPIRVVTNDENTCDIADVVVMVACQLVPDKNGAVAAKGLLEDVAVMEGPVLALISGGGHLGANARSNPGAMGSRVAIVDGGTLDRIAMANGDIQALLVDNDSYAAFALADALLIMWATGTNIADLDVLIRQVG